MDIVIESVKLIRVLLDHSGCSDAGVILDIDPDVPPCQFEQGTTMTATFGGRSAVFTTPDPIQAPTKVSYMFDAPLDSLPVRGAATAIINAVLGFLCMSRALHPCPTSCHESCREQLLQSISGKQIWCIGSAGATGNPFPSTVAEPAHAGIILIFGDGIIADGTGDIIEDLKGSTRILCIGPSTAGVAQIHDLEHWCPYGKGRLG